MSDETPEPTLIGPVAPGTITVPPAPATRRPPWVLYFVSTILIGLVLAVMIGWISNLVDRNERLNARVSDQADTISEKDSQIADLTDDLITSNANAQNLYDQLLALGQEPEGVDPEVIVPTPGAQGPQGEQGPGPTDSQVLAGVTQYCLLVIC
jgi:hypothetical protein